MNRSPSGPNLSLSPDQETLLRTALSSNPRDSLQSAQNIDMNAKNVSYSPNGNTTMDDSLPTSPEEANGVNGHGQDLIDGLLDEFDDGNFEWDGNDEQLFGDLHPNESLDESELHDKRKASTGSEDSEQGSNKKQEGDSKAPKKPGRKPLTAEPTTVCSTLFPMLDVL